MSATRQAARIQREAYPVKRLELQTRRTCYEQLWHNDRKYEGSQTFDINRMKRHLSEVVFERKVNSYGKFNFYAQSVYLGSRHRSQIVRLSYEMEKNYFVVKEQIGEVIGYVCADNFSSDNAVALTVCQNRYVKCSNFVSV